MSYNASKASNKQICHSLDISPYDVAFWGWHFRFSTQKHQDKFCADLLKHKAWLDDSLSRRFHIDFNSGLLAAISLYQRIEGRGFYIYNEELDMTYRDANDVYMTVVM